VSIRSYAGGIVVAGYFSPSPSDANSTEGNVIEQNVITGGGASTQGIILASYAHDNLVRSNDVSRFFDGIWTPSYADRNEISGNRVWANLGVGIRVAYSTYEVRDIRVVGNDVWGNGSDGIALASTASDSLVERNRARANGDDGIDVDRAGNQVTANRARANADWGIEAVPGVIDGGRNFAHKNGQPGQCLEILCRPGH